MTQEKKVYAAFIKNKFLNQDVHIVASGPSLLGFDYSRLENKNVIAVNHACRLVKNNLVVFNDSNFPHREHPELLSSENVIACSRAAKISASRAYTFKLVDRFYPDPESGVYSPRSSGVAAITVALQAGAGKIYLWGFDCRFLTKENAIIAANVNHASKEAIDFIKNSNRHFFGHSTSEIFKHNMDEVKHASIFENTIELFKIFPRHSIFNMSQFSKIPFFEHKEADDVL